MTGNRAPAGRFFALALSIAMTGCMTQSELEMEGENAFQEMRTQIPISSSVADRVYVTCIVRPIIEQLGEPYASYDWEIEVFDDEAANAFALPGGKIGVFNGIFEVAKNQDQLAAVLGHEVAHVTENHSMERANQQQMVGYGAVVGGAVLGSSTGIGAGNTTDALSILGQYGLMMPFGRGQESEADVVGLEYMAAAGFDPRQSIELWKNMEEATGSGPPAFMSTHPSPDTRIGDLIRQLPETLPVYNQAVADGNRPDCQH